MHTEFQFTQQTTLGTLHLYNYFIGHVFFYSPLFSLFFIVATTTENHKEEWDLARYDDDSSIWFQWRGFKFITDQVFQLEPILVRCSTWRCHGTSLLQLIITTRINYEKHRHTIRIGNISGNWNETSHESGSLTHNLASTHEKIMLCACSIAEKTTRILESSFMTREARCSSRSSPTANMCVLA